MDIFEIIPENFFSLLASKNKKIYLAAILETFKVYEMGSILGIDKKVIADDLTHFLDNEFNLYKYEDDYSNERIESRRELTNHILRRMEECGWIYIDVMNDYSEILNFSDVAITIIEALIKIEPIVYDEYAEDAPGFVAKSKNEYQGYIFTIYSLLTSVDVMDSTMLITNVYNYTKLLIRSLRKLDSRLKDYISSVVEISDIKGLMEKLIMYKSELVDQTYNKLKTSDNINKYRLEIVKKLESFQNDERVMNLLALEYTPRFRGNTIDATKKANRDLDEIIDVFNSIDEFIDEIDFKNKTYINSTIGKIKFLLSEDDNVIGKLNGILKYIKTESKDNHLDRALKNIQPMFKLSGIRTYSPDSALYTPRGSYSHNYNQIIDFTRFEDIELEKDFIAQTYLPYNELSVGKFLVENLKNGVLIASDIIKENTEINTVWNTLFCLLYVNETEYEIEVRPTYIQHNLFKMKDFIIRRKGWWYAW